MAKLMYALKASKEKIFTRNSHGSGIKQNKCPKAKKINR